ncbi:hypothetical protein RYZ26_02005 [Terasakiella sp. A23]|uniref:hypothetical protein n=1 Tax=Terasakiella sp. FCG-A23 TaxID=3080561 RepID=UPI002953991D|nr:hypothetical protein [Terasakiella sp. A23]MDV7338352.1 hypothetical protein [Terasakiella sp. A23]
MDNTQSTLLRAGGKDQLLADFTALKEATTLDGLPKYSERPTLDQLAKFISAQSGGPNKDMALLELSHLVYGVADVLGADCITDFFLSPEKASPNRIKSLFADATDTSSVIVTGDYLRLSYEGKQFDVRYGRMGFLISLYEFLCSMDGFQHFTVMTDLFETLINDPLSDKSLKACTNSLASVLRKYRIANLTTAEADGKFVQVYKFLQEKSEENQIILQDDSVLDFWCLHNKGKDYRGYRTVFDLFCDFSRSFEEAKLGENAHQAATLGVNIEEGEVDIASSDIDAGPLEDWVSPFAVFDEDDFNDIRFFKKKSERGPIESLMTYGPDAMRLPLAFLRYEIFGQVQSGITNDLQVGRGKASVEKRIACDDVPAYEDRLTECETIRDHVKALQASTLHILSQDQSNVVAFPTAAQDEAKKAFSKMNRKGFDDNAVENMEAFRKAADSLVQMEAQLDRYIGSLKSKNLESVFDEDRTTFKNQFSHLYEEALK